MSSLDDLKTMLGLGKTTEQQEAILQLIQRNTDLQLKFKLGVKSDSEIPAELAYIPIEVAVKRYNRLKNEGMASYTQEGESITFNSNDFDDYEADIAEWRKRNKADVLLVLDPYKKRGGNDGV